jgi:VanZ family protein
MTFSRATIAFFRFALAVTAVVILHLATTEYSYPMVEGTNDKVNHLLAFGTLSLLIDWSFPRSRFAAAKIATLVAYGVLIEFIQYFLPTREASSLDLLADCVGIAAYAIGFAMIGRVPLLRPVDLLRQNLAKG